MDTENEKKLENNFLAHDGMNWEEIEKLNEEIRRAIRETDLELGELL